MMSLFSRGVTKERSPTTLPRDRFGHRAARMRVRPLVDLMEGRTLLSILVSNAGDSGPGSLRAAIEQANATPDTITFAPSVTGTITLTSSLMDLSKDITIQGPGPKVLAVAHSAAPGTPAFRIFNVTVSAHVTISGLAITGGRVDNSGNGGGIANTGTLTVTDCFFSDNAANNVNPGGGGIANSGALTVTNSTFSGNSSGQGGGIDNTGTATVTGSAFSRNTAAFSGGGIANSGVLMVTSSTLSGNSVEIGVGGGIFNYNSGTATVTGCTLNGNKSASAFLGGGGIFNTGSGALTVVNTTLSDNAAMMGGAIGNFANLDYSDHTSNKEASGCV
jgi:hypothetical protein